MLTILLIACAAGLGFKTYKVWQEGPWDVPQAPKGKAVAVAAASQQPVGPLAQAAMGTSTETIVSKNLFDPERGAVKPTQESDAEVRAVQRIRNLVLLGTAIIGNSRYAIVQEPDNAPQIPGVPGQPPRPQTVRRLRVGDNVEGFSVTEIDDRRVTLTRGASRVEVSVDYFRKVAPPVGSPIPGPGVPRPGGAVGPGAVQVPQIPTPGPTPPNVIPTLPRRPRLPTPPTAPSP